MSAARKLSEVGVLKLKILLRVYMPKTGMCGAPLDLRRNIRRIKENTSNMRGGVRMVKIALQQRHYSFPAYFYKQLKKRHLDSMAESRIVSDEDFFHACTAVVANIARK